MDCIMAGREMRSEVEEVGAKEAGEALLWVEKGWYRKKEEKEDCG